MKGFVFQRLAGRIACFAASIIEGPSCLGGHTSVSFGHVHERGVQLAARLCKAGLVQWEVPTIRLANCTKWVVWDMAYLINVHVLQVLLHGRSEVAS